MHVTNALLVIDGMDIEKIPAISNLSKKKEDNKQKTLSDAI